ncbi:MAG: AzlD domain-containing protein [Cellvibrionaceae bacterium]
MIWLLIFIMALITFYNRYALMSPRLKLTLGDNAQRLLKYTAPAVLTGLWAPIVFTEHHQFNSDITSPYLIAGFVTVVLSRFVKAPLLVVGLGMGTFFLVGWLR